MEDLSGKQLGQYRIVTPIGEGGMAAVYKAYQTSVERYVALKILPRHYASDPNFVHRFKREAKIVAGLEHPGIVPIYDFGEEDGYTYLVMRFVEGGTLADLLAGQSLSLEKIIPIIAQISGALDYAHTHDVIHRDVKPSNVLMDQQGNCLLMDFGLAKVLLSSSKLTSSGAFLGTPTYASPEQCLGKELDKRSDIYSLGVMLYEMATGRPPFDAETPMAVVVKHIYDPLPLPTTINPALPVAVERVILKALAKKPADRYQSAGELAEALKAAVAEGARETPAISLATLPPEQITDQVKRSVVPFRAIAQKVKRSLAFRRIKFFSWGWAIGALILLGLIAVLTGVIPTLPMIIAGPSLTPVPTMAPVSPIVTVTKSPTKAEMPSSTPSVTVEAVIAPSPTSTPPASDVVIPRPVLIVDKADNLHLTWVDSRGIYYALSQDNGATFAMPIDIDTFGAIQNVTMAVGTDGMIHIAWQDKRNGNWDIYYTRLNNTDIFSSPIRVNDDTSGKDQVWPALAVDADGNVYLAWQDNRSGNEVIYYARSLSSGAYFNKNLPVADSTRGRQITPAIGVDSLGRRFVAWAGDQSGKWMIYSAHAESDRFSSAAIVGTGLMSDLSNSLPSLTIAPDDRIHLVWANGYVLHPIYLVPVYLPVYSFSADGGKTFTSPKQIGTGYSYVSVRPNEVGIAVTNSAVHTVLTTYSPRDGSWVWYYQSTDGGQTFRPGVKVIQSDGGDVYHYPVVAVDSAGHIHIAWAYQRGSEWDVFYTQSTDGGVTFSTPVKINGQ